MTNLVGWQPTGGLVLRNAVASTFSFQGLREDMDKHLLANPFPEEGEGHRPV